MNEFLLKLCWIPPDPVYLTHQSLTEDPPKFDMDQGAMAFDAWKHQWANHSAQATERFNPEGLQACHVSLGILSLFDDTWNCLVNQHDIQIHLEDPDVLVNAMKQYLCKTTRIINIILTTGSKPKKNSEKYDFTIQKKLTELSNTLSSFAKMM